MCSCSANRGLLSLVISLSLLFSVPAMCLADPLLRGVEEAELDLKEGDSVPEFEARTGDGLVWRSSDYVGRKFIVVYFYPADLTSGCVQQAIAYRDAREHLDAAGIEVVGVSGDSPENHALFKRLHSLNFSLLSDEQGRLAKAFGVPVGEGDTILRSFDGVEHSLTRGVTASRWTFLIGKDGKVVQKNTSVDPEADCQNVLETVRRLTADTE